MVSQARKSLVATRVALANELGPTSRISFPGAATLFSDVDSPIALAFLRRFPSVTQAAWLTEARLAIPAPHGLSGAQGTQPGCSDVWPTPQPSWPVPKVKPGPQ